MLIQKIHCVTTKAKQMEIKPRYCPFLRTVSMCKYKTISKWQYLKEIMAGVAWSG